MLNGNLLTSLALWALLTFRAESLNCPPSCERWKCPEVRHCIFGVTEDACGCCEVCLQGIGEECGGIRNIGGTCAEGLRCEPLDPNNWQLPGICVPVNYDQQ